MKILLLFVMALFVLNGCTSVGSSSRLVSRLSAPQQDTHSSALAFQSDATFGRSLNEQEKQQLSRAEKKALEYGAVGEEIGWKSVTQQVSGTILASRPFRVGRSNCRRFEHRLIIENKHEKLFGTACQRDGEPWRLVQ